MSTAYSSAKQQYIGNGVTTEWGFDFPIQKHSELKVYLKRSGSTQVLLEEGVDYSFVTENTIAFPIKTGEAKLQAADVLALQRESVFESEYNFSNQQRLEPEEVMHADDNLERQIQELKRDVTQAIRIQPTSNINTDEYFIAVESIYENLDNINNVSEHSSEIITCSNNIEAIQDAPNQANAAMNFKIEAEGNANDARNSKIEAQNSAVTAQLRAAQAQDWATKTDGKVDGTNYSSKYYAGQASDSAQAAQDALNEVQGLIATPIGTIFQSVYVDESMDIARQLNGQLISSTKFTGFRSWLNTVQTDNPNLFTTETNWQAEKTNSKLGQCGKFVIDDTAQTIRLPAVVNPQGLLSLSGIGNLVNESLPNISGDASLGAAGQNSLIVGHWSGTGFFSTRETTDGPVVSSGGTTTGATHRFLTADASRSSSTYQNNAPVQQEAVQYPYYIQVATGVEETLPAIREYNINTPFFFGQSMYSDVAPDNASWLASNGQYNAKTVYPDYYDWLVEQMNAGVSGFLNSVMYAYSPSGSGIIFTLPTLTPKVGMVCYGYSDGSYENIPLSVITSVTDDGAFQAEFQGTNYVFVRNPEKDQTTSYPTDYDFVINTTDQTFRLPLLNGEEDLPSGEFLNWSGYVTTMETDLPVAPCNGYLAFAGNATATVGYIYSDATKLGQGSGQTTAQSFRRDVIFLKKGDISHCYISDVNGVGSLKFIKAKGNGSLYYYVGDTVQDASLINAGAVLGQLSNKADINASNFNTDGKSLLSGFGMPSNRYIDLTLGASGSTYTAPANGYFVVTATSTSASRALVVFEKSHGICNGDHSYSDETGLRCFVPCQKGKSTSLIYSGATITGLWFVYAEGDKNV